MSIVSQTGKKEERNKLTAEQIKNFKMAVLSPQLIIILYISRLNLLIKRHGAAE